VNIATRAFEPTHSQVEILRDQLEKLLLESDN